MHESVSMICEERSDEAIPSGNEYWQLNLVSLEKYGNRALISITRPGDLNALNRTVVRPLLEKFQEADSDPNVSEIFITGRGKAFVAGADIKFFLDNMKAN